MMAAVPVPAYAAEKCTGSGALPLPTWHEYVVGADCKIPKEFTGKTIVLIMMGIFNIILYLAGFLAVIMVIYGGYKLVVSTGEPQKIAGARSTILNALIGLAIAIVASQVVGFIAGRLAA
jgi:hypothetical protein